MNELYNIISYKVLVNCMTYNQSRYILDALKGFSLQQTDFPFACLVMDDASTDGEQDVIYKYLQTECDLSIYEEIDTEESRIVVAPHKENSNCVFICYFLKRNLFGTTLKETLKNPWIEKCEYVALCEGDDYWKYDNKLSVQVNYLDEHPEISLSCCRYSVWSIDSQEIEMMPNPYFDNDNIGDNFTFSRDVAFGGKAWLTKTPTCVYRKSACHMDFISQFKYSRDVHLFYDVLSYGNGVCHAFDGAVYRISGQGIYGGKSALEHNKIDYAVYSEFCTIVNDPVLNNILYRLFCNLVYAREWPLMNTRMSRQLYLKFIINKGKSLINRILKW